MVTGRGNLTTAQGIVSPLSKDILAERYGKREPGLLARGVGQQGVKPAVGCSR
jgi:hypothetical protein